ncbi:MAG: GNAT family N-acetyltransferase [Dongiaceae bacterium]
MIAGVRLRPFTAEDTAAAIELRNLAFAELAGGAYTAEQLAALRSNRDAAAYGAELALNHIMLAFNGALGLVAMGGWIAMPDDATIGRIRKLAVHPAAARHGLGRLMVEDAERRAEETGCKHFIVRASLNAVPFYERLGYRVTSHGVVPTAAGIDVPMAMMEKVSDL